MVWYSHLLKNFPQFVVIYIVNGLGVVNEAEVNVFLELSYFFCDPTDVGNLISSSSAFSKSCLNIWKFLVHMLLKPSVVDFEHYTASLQASLIAQLVKNPPAMQETLIQFLGREDPLEKR